MTPERERQHQFYSEITYANEAGHDGYAADVARKAIAEGCPEAEVFEVLGYELAPNSDAPAIVEQPVQPEPRPLRILVACETSGAVRNAFRAAGHDAWSCDILPSDDDSPYHIIGDAIEAAYGQPWDMLVAHPPCTYLAASGLHWNHRVPGRTAKTDAALQFVRILMNAPIHHIAIENPVGRISTAIRPADQYIQPHEYGHDASKRTGLWLKNLPALTPTAHVAPRIVNGKPRWSNQTDSGQNRLGPSPDRWKRRSETYTGIAAAMATQWPGGNDA
jgi:hypothetical protein